MSLQSFLIEFPATRGALYQIWWTCIHSHIIRWVLVWHLRRGTVLVHLGSSTEIFGLCTTSNRAVLHSSFLGSKWIIILIRVLVYIIIVLCTIACILRLVISIWGLLSRRFTHSTCRWLLGRLPHLRHGGILVHHPLIVITSWLVTHVLGCHWR